MSEMTGLERLRELGREQEERSWSTVGKVRGRLMLQIAEQIEDERFREQLAVERVASEMELHCLGVEGMEDSPVARWARELREALASSEAEETRRDPAADVSVSAYDLLPQDEREAIAWVREHGGLDAVRKLARHETKEEVELVALGKLRCLAGVQQGESASIAEMVESIARRLMPEGVEWPRYESGELVEVGDGISVTVHDEDGDFERTMAAESVSFDGHGVIIGDSRHVVRLLSGERVRRPESKCRDCAHWQKDPTADKMGVCWFFYHEHEGQDCYPARLGDIGVCDEFMPRARALAERERGE